MCGRFDRTVARYCAKRYRIVRRGYIRSPYNGNSEAVVEMGEDTIRERLGHVLDGYIVDFP